MTPPGDRDGTGTDRITARLAAGDAAAVLLDIERLLDLHTHQPQSMCPNGDLNPEALAGTSTSS